MSFLEIIDYWFDHLTPSQWFAKDSKLDNEIRTRFGEVHERAARSELSEWRHAPDGRLAEVIVLDQFSRNIYRDEPRAFACDPLALALAQDAIQVGDDQKLALQRRIFMYMPFMHSESKAIHEMAVQLFKAPGMEYNLEYELKHKAIIDRFGRYPHRNPMLGRTSTSEEIEFLRTPGSAF